MAQAMIKGILENAYCAPDQIRCTSATDGTGEAAATRFGISYTPDLDALVDPSDTLILAIKPQQLNDLPSSIAEDTQGKLIVSILAGTPLKKLQATFPKARNIVRAMPNTPGMIGHGVTAYASANTLSETDDSIAVGLLGALGKLISLPEDKLDAVTGVSGSGPAYLFEFVAALRDGGIAAGLDSETAYTLALETTRGAAELLKQVPETPEQHRDWVSSPGGTTLAGLGVMKSHDVRQILKDTVLAAAARSKELAQD